MSHITTIKCQIKDLKLLQKACEKVGLEFKEGQKTFKWYKSPKECNHAISVPNNKNAYEIGIVKKDDNYTMLFDFWNGGYGLKSIAGHNCENITDAYAQEVALKEATAFAQEQGWSVSHEFDEETSETVIKLRKY